jgi:hypothetical protein
MIDYSNLKNFVDAAINVYDPVNNRVIGASTAICSWRESPAALLIAPGGGYYHLVRRDVSSTAHSPRGRRPCPAAGPPR